MFLGHAVGDDALIQWAERLESVVRPADTVAGSGGRGLRFTASVGIALAGPDGTRESLIRRADAAMYQAKAAGSGYAVAP